MVKTKKHPVTFYEEVRIWLLESRGIPNLDTDGTEESHQDQETSRNLISIPIKSKKHPVTFYEKVGISVNKTDGISKLNDQDQENTEFWW